MTLDGAWQLFLLLLLGVAVVMDREATAILMGVLYLDARVSSLTP